MLLKAQAQVDISDDDLPGNPLQAELSGSPRPASAASALLRATERNADRPIIEELISAGANVAAMDADMNQPLHLAVRQGNLRVVRILLDSQADPNCCNGEMRTPVHAAVGLGDPRIIKLLVEYRGDLNLEDRNGTAPIQMATNAGRQQLYGKLAASKFQLAATNSAPSLALPLGRHGLPPAKACPSPDRQSSDPKCLQGPASSRSSPSLTPANSSPATPVCRKMALSVPRRTNGRRTPHVAWG